MTLTIDLTQEEDAQLQVVASIRGVKPEEHAHTLLANILRSVPVPEQERRTDQEERERLIADAKSGDLAARLRLMEMTPTIPVLDLETGEPTPLMSRELSRSEFIYED